MKELIVYGAGLLGPAACEVMQEQGCSVLCVLDQFKSGKIHNIPIVHPRDIEKLNSRSAPIYLTLVNPDHEVQVLEFLKSLKSRPDVKSFHDLLFEFPQLISKKKRAGFAWMTDDCFDSNHRGCESYFSDLKSREIVRSWMKFRETADPKYYVEPEGSQYVPKDLNWIEKLYKHEATFLDIGAYTGDSCEFFIKKFRDAGKNIQNYFSFEVDPKNFVHLGANMRSLSKKYPQTHTMSLPLGIWSDYGLIHIDSSGSATQVFKDAPSNKAGLQIPVAKLDDLFLSMPVDVIKMDIEGSERAALAGADRIIREQSPVLLISLYHKPNDLWELPEMIRKMNPNYDMYIRVHAHLFIETVLYCVPRQDEEG